MRLFRLVGVLGAVVAVALTSAVGATARSAAFKTGTYKLMNRTNQLPPGGTVTLKHAQCAGKLQLCVTLPKSPAILCVGGPSETLRTGDFAPPVALPSSGKVTEHAPFSVDLSAPGQSPLEATGQSVFSIAFRKNGTASGSFEESLTYPLLSSESAPEKCSGKASFTAKLA
jgi:hypothetical protein